MIIMITFHLMINLNDLKKIKEAVFEEVIPKNYQWIIDN